MRDPVYQYAQFSFVKQEIANRLYDSSKQFWSDSELGRYLYEALRTWNSLTSYWRGDFLFSTVENQYWYDLTSATSDSPPTNQSLRPYTVLDTDIYEDMEYALLEPATGIDPWTGSLQFSADDLLNAVQRRRDEILSITGCTASRITTPAVNARITLPDDVLDVRRIAYFPAGGLNPQPSVMWEEDAWGAQAYDRDYTILPPYTVVPPGQPMLYFLSTQPPISFDTDTAPGAGGYYELIVVQAGNTLVVGTPSTFPIPDDWTYILKWGALGDLLARESWAKDPARAEYCNARYRMGLALLAKAPALLQLRANNVALQIDSVRDADLFNTTWQAQDAASPQMALTTGLNLVGISPKPDYPLSTNYSMTATVVRNAPLPVLDTDYVQVGRDDLDAVIDYAQHLASFKMGGSEFQDTVPLFQRFLKQATLYGLKLDEMGEYLDAILGISQRDEQTNPRADADALQSKVTAP